MGGSRVKPSLAENKSENSKLSYAIESYNLIPTKNH